MTEEDLVSTLDAVRKASIQAQGKHADEAFLKLAGGADMVLLGVASHGTHEFYHECARLTKKLIEEKGFSAVAVEADWPDAANGTSDNWSK